MNMDPKFAVAAFDRHRVMLRSGWKTSDHHFSTAGVGIGDFIALCIGMEMK